MIFEENFDLNRENSISQNIQKLFGHEVFTPGFDRTKYIYSEFIESFKKRKIKIITVAGTNGKGQTSHTINYYLTQNKINSGLWTSPHILSIRERFVYNNKMISYDELESLISNQTILAKLAEYKYSYYEFLFFVFLNWVSQFDLEFIILEVGLGGRLDAVNHFDCDLALITSISRDHQKILGSRYDLILEEKLGITRPNSKLITCFKLNYLIDKTNAFSKLREIKFENIQAKETYFESNIALALAAINYFNLKPKNENLPPIFKGREESIATPTIDFEFIGAHNPDGIREMIKSIQKNDTFKDILLISFSDRDKNDFKSMISSLVLGFKGKSRIALTHFSHPKAASKQILEDVARPLCNNKEIEYIEDWKSFLNGIRNQSEKKTIMVIGSYYFIGEVQRYIFNNFKS